MARRPNVLWIITTQWRAQAFGYAGDGNARTPRIDALAAQSVDFRQAVTPHPFGPFARAAMFTGLLSPGNGVRAYFDPLPRTARTIAHELSDLGYLTAFFGKWHLGNRDVEAPLVGEAHATTLVAPNARGGFRFWEGFESGFVLNDPWLHGTRLPEPVRFEGYQSDVVCSLAAGWLSAQTAEWFCVVSLEPPHPPYDAPASGIAPRDPGSIALSANVPRGGIVEERARKELAGYYAHIEATDRAVGRLVDRADDSGQPTAIVFASAHGDMHGSHGLFRKGWPHEESVRIPLLVREPARKAGSSDAAVSLVDLPRITLALASGSPVADVPCPAFAHISMPTVVRLPHQCDRVWRGFRSRERKFVLGKDGTPWLFFDLGGDPLENVNLLERAGQTQIPQVF